MAEAEGSARRYLASRRLRIAEWGLLSAFLIALVIVGCATYAAVHGAEMVGLAGVLSTVAALVAVFITGKRNPPPNGASEGEEEPKKRTGQ